MADILHRIIIPADPSRVFAMIEAPDAIKLWWTQDISGSGNEGDDMQLGFNGRKAELSMHVDSVVRPQRLIWSCQYRSGGMDEWPGTRLIWSLTPWKSGETDLRFTHAGWKSVEGEFAACNTLWGQLLVRLKFAAMGKSQGAMFY